MPQPSDRDLVRLYWPAGLRDAFDALSAIDAAMADVVAKATQPALAAVKLAWWRERLEELDSGKAPVEPRLRAVAAELLPRGVSGAMLAQLEDGWAALLEEAPDAERAAARGEHLFAIGAVLLGSSDPLLAVAGRLYAVEDIGRKGLARLQFPAEERQRLRAHRFRARLRPLTALARLAARDADKAPEMEPEGTPGRAMALIAHRLTGRVA